MLNLWIEEGFDEAEEAMQQKAKSSKKGKKQPCACGNAVCCGKHKGGQCSCQNQKRERD